MQVETLLLFASIIMIASVSPGPNVMLILNHSIQFGARHIVPTILGNLCCLLLLASLVAFGVGAVLQGSPELFNALKFCGGVYLIYMGLKSIRSANRSKTLSDALPSDGGSSARRGRFIEAFLISATNPKSILFLASVFPAFINPEQPILNQFFLLFTIIICVVGSIHFGYAILAATLNNIVTGVDFRVWVARLSGATFIALGTIAFGTAISYFVGWNL